MNATIFKRIIPYKRSGKYTMNNAVICGIVGFLIAPCAYAQSTPSMLINDHPNFPMPSVMNVVEHQLTQEIVIPVEKKSEPFDPKIHIPSIADDLIGNIVLPKLPANIKQPTHSSPSSDDTIKNKPDDNPTENIADPLLDTHDPETHQTIMKFLDETDRYVAEQPINPLKSENNTSISKAQLSHHLYLFLGNGGLQNVPDDIASSPIIDFPVIPERPNNYDRQPEPAPTKTSEGPIATQPISLIDLTIPTESPMALGPPSDLLIEEEKEKEKEKEKEPKQATLPSFELPAKPAPNIGTITVKSAPSPDTPNAPRTEQTSIIAPQEKPYTPNHLTESDHHYIDTLEQQQKDLPTDERLSKSTQTIMDSVADTLSSHHRGTAPKTKHIDINRSSHNFNAAPSISTDKTQPPKKDVPKAILSIRDFNSNPKLDLNERLHLAYKALMTGQTSAAVRLYKEVLDEEYNNHDALFGLATAYHRNQQLDEAKAIYTELLEINPEHAEALNNFLVLAATESPKDALIELEKLQRINPKFSPIPAQIAMILSKTGKLSQARNHLKRAIALSPDNIIYQYNLAVIADKLKLKNEAIFYYDNVLNAANHGVPSPGSKTHIKNRLNYLTSRQ